MGGEGLDAGGWGLGAGGWGLGVSLQHLYSLNLSTPIPEIYNYVVSRQRLTALRLRFLRGNYFNHLNMIVGENSSDVTQFTM